MEFNRSDAILKYIVEYFIKHAQPVSSQTLIDEYKLPYSSATIRNEMFALEKLGLIEKTHTSSGRVPSSEGYKYYCEHLRNKDISDEFKNSIQTILDSKVQSIEEVIKESCEILSHMTSLVSVVMGPDEKAERLASMQMIQISDNSLTAVFVTNKGYVENKTFIVPEGIDPKEIISCVQLLNERLVGTPIVDLVPKTEALKPILSDYIISHDLVYQALLEAFARFASDRLSLYGREELFSHPEFRDADKLEKVFKLLNDPEALKAMNKDSKDDTEASVHIGDIEDNPDVSMVSAKINLGDEGGSTIALVGPKRMDYDKVLSALEYITEALGNYFNNKKDNNGEGGKSDA